MSPAQAGVFSCSGDNASSSPGPGDTAGSTVGHSSMGGHLAALCLLHNRLSPSQAHRSHGNHGLLHLASDLRATKKGRDMRNLLH